MEPVTVATIILASIALISATLANLRVRSKCKNEMLGLDVSITKRFNEDLGRTTPPMRGSTEDDEYSL